MGTYPRTARRAFPEGNPHVGHTPRADPLSGGWASEGPLGPLNLTPTRLGIRTELEGGCLYIFGNTPVGPGKLCFFRFLPGISLSAKGCPGPKWPKKLVFRDYLPLGVRLAKAENGKKWSNFGEKLLGQPYFPPKGTSSTGKICFSVFRPEFIQVPRAVLGQKGLKSQ